ncbi:MAG: glucose 1-dehydrogenase [Candidatus Krumholzibacteria bacterium]|nr:glucose 1-dehydrogenase [Candidatus Krumholzibacteria bacterium]MDH4337785.1 glucose 1-dehydrogenase [Candidatus Krumholzibacteria bacterium]MDH5270839.1 glucose 1-dehydrogenase [Candidatus Krumholzibacteria bacterium]
MKDFLKRNLLGGGGPPARGERFRGKVVVVTGASAGIGLATAVAFAAEGASVALLARREKEGNDALERVRRAGGEEARPMFVQTDVADTAQVQAAFAAIRDAFGRVDAAFNNAGAMHKGAPMAALGEDDFDRVMAVNVKGVWLCMREEIALMEQNAPKHGAAIVNMASMSGVVGVARLASYTASKYAVIGLTKSAALDYATAGIRINALCPGYVRTDMTRPVPDERVKQRVPVGYMSEPEEMAAAVLWMCSDEARYLVGHAMVIDGGVTAG